MTAFSEHALIEQLRAGDRRAFAHLYDCYAGALLGEIIRRVGYTAVAEDLLQESIVSLFLHMDTYDPAKGRLYTWMLTIVRNKCIDYLRSADHRSASVTETLADEHVAIPQAVEIKLQTDRLRQEVNERHGRDARAFELVYVQGCTHQQAAALCDLPVGTLKTRMRSLVGCLRAV